MKTTKVLLLLVILLLLSGSIIAQNIYEIQPGTKGNEIKLMVANVSEENPATNVNIVLTRKSSALSFNKETETIEMIEAKSEAEALFTFDINRNATVNKKDTIDFMISDGSGIMMTKQFIFSYTGPKEFKLEQNYPNPFNPTTTIQYQLPQDARVTLKIYDILGSEVATLVNEEQEAGYKEVQFNGSNIASGMYVYRLQAGDYISTKKMMLLK
ncbi:MAG TPA: T9SS type A sorting domain-containing protein [Ignavibacteriaceae bacterium]|nr:T9SS type A sorting domain-containing protein [Ignavibacteriaceae bacterium]